MRLTFLCLLLLCCESAGAQTAHVQMEPMLTCPDGSGPTVSFTLKDGTWDGYPFHWDCRPITAPKQLICDWQTDHWYCPTREPISNTNGKLLPELMIMADGSVRYCEDLKKYSAVSCTTLPFDVPPKEWDGPDTHAANTCPPPDEHGKIGACTAIYIEEKTHHVACEDKTRFLLTDESGKKHCLRLVP